MATTFLNRYHASRTLRCRVGWRRKLITYLSLDIANPPDSTLMVGRLLKNPQMPTFFYAILFEHDDPPYTLLG